MLVKKLQVCTSEIMIAWHESHENTLGSFSLSLSLFELSSEYAAPSARV
jgi:hypothetical protein